MRGTIVDDDQPPLSVNLRVDANDDGLLDSQDDLVEDQGPGAFVMVNEDDDDENDVPDVLQQAVDGENDLAALALEIAFPDAWLAADSPAAGYRARLVAASGGDTVRVFRAADKLDEIALAHDLLFTELGTATTADGLARLRADWFVEAVDVGRAALDLVVVDDRGAELARDRVRLTTHATSDPTPRLRIDDATLREGKLNEVLVRLTAPSDEPIAVGWVVEPVAGGATLDDFAAPHSGVIEFGPNETRRAVSLRAVDDALYEATEPFAVTIAALGAAPVGIERGVATVSIEDNDPPPVLRWPAGAIPIAILESAGVDWVELALSAASTSDVQVT